MDKIKNLYWILNRARRMADSEIAQALQEFVLREYELVIALPLGEEENHEVILIISKDGEYLQCRIQKLPSYLDDTLWHLKVVPKKLTEGTRKPKVNDIVRILEYTSVKYLVLIEDMLGEYRAWIPMRHLELI